MVVCFICNSVFARVCARMRREMARNAVFMGVLGRSDWKSDGGTIVPPILRQNVRRDGVLH